MRSYHPSRFLSISILPSSPSCPFFSFSLDVSTVSSITCPIVVWTPVMCFCSLTCLRRRDLNRKQAVHRPHQTRAISNRRSYDEETAGISLEQTPSAGPTLLQQQQQQHLSPRNEKMRGWWSSIGCRPRDRCLDIQRFTGNEDRTKKEVHGVKCFLN